MIQLTEGKAWHEDFWWFLIYTELGSWLNCGNSVHGQIFVLHPKRGRKRTLSRRVVQPFFSLIYLFIQGGLITRSYRVSGNEHLRLSMLYKQQEKCWRVHKQNKATRSLFLETSQSAHTPGATNRRKWFFQRPHSFSLNVMLLIQEDDSNWVN